LKIQISVHAATEALEKYWITQLKGALSSFPDLKDLQVVPLNSQTAPESQMVFFDAASPGLSLQLSATERKGKGFFLISRDVANSSAEMTEGLVDDVLIFPFRPVEVASKIKACQQILMWDEVSQINTSFSEIVNQLKDDLQLAERLQLAKLPIRFPDVSGFKINQRYMAGLRSGGDYFDIAESREGNLMSIVLSDSSSYGLSSQVLSVLMRVALKLTTEEVRSTYETVKRIQNELGAVLGDHEKLSLFYGVLSRRDYRLRYLNLGSACIFYADKGEPFQLLPSQGNPITRRGQIAGVEAEIQLQPDGRLMVLSDGFVEILGGMESLQSTLQTKRDRDPKEILNELVFGVKSKLETAEDMPAQDCTAAIFDVDSRIIRLAKS